MTDARRGLYALLVALTPATAQATGARLCGGLAYVCSAPRIEASAAPSTRLLELPGAPRPGVGTPVARWSREQLDSLKDAPRPVIEAAAEALLDEGRPAETRPLLEFLETGASTEQNCTLEALRMEADRRERTLPRAATVQRLQEQLRRLEASPSSERCASLTLEVGATLAAEYHLLVTGRDADAGRIAGELYDALLPAARDTLRFSRLPEALWPTPGALRFSRGALAWSLGDWEGCGRIFGALSAAGPGGPLASVFAGRCHVQRINTAFSTTKPRIDFRLAPGEAPFRPLQVWEQGALEDLDRSACVAPDEAPMRLAAAKLLLASGRPGEAAAELRALLDRAPSSEQANLGVLFLEAAGRAAARGDDDCIDEAEEMRSRVWEAACSSRTGPACAALERLDSPIAQTHAAALRRRAEADPLRANELNEQAGKLLLDAARRCALDPIERKDSLSCERPEDLLWSAAEAFAAAHLPLKSIRVRLLLLAPRYRLLRTEQAQRSVLAIARSHESLTDFETAASWYENFATEYPAAPEVALALERAVQLRLALSQEPEAARGAELLRGRAHRGHTARAVAASLALVQYHTNRGAWDAAARRLEEAWSFLREQGTFSDRIAAFSLQGRIRGAQGLDQRASYRAALDLWTRNNFPADEQALSAVAEARLFELNESTRKLQSQRAPVLPGRPELNAMLRHLKGPFSGWLTQRRQSVEALEKSVEQFVKNDPPFPSSWQAEAQTRVFEAWRSLEQEASSPRWTGLPGILPGLRKPLEEQLETVRERTTSAAWACFRSAVQAGSFGEATRACERWLARHADYRPLDDTLMPRPIWQGTPSSERPRLWLRTRPQNLPETERNVSFSLVSRRRPVNMRTMFQRTS